MASRTLLVSAILAGACFLPGCTQSGPELGNVEGTVTMDGKPLPMAYVTFRRQDGSGRPSMGCTDKNGRYELGYSLAREGALLGDFVVSISTFRDQPDVDTEGNPIPKSPETVPARYNVNSELTAKVEPGSQEIDFELSSDGQIVSQRPAPVKE